MTGTPTHHGLNCACCSAPALAASTPADLTSDGGQSATSNVTDIRRARQRARSVVRNIMDDVIAWLGSANLQQMLDSPRGDRAVNRAITNLASERLRAELVDWLDERHRTTMGRAARMAFDAMQQALPDQSDVSFRDRSSYGGEGDRHLARLLRQVDAGLLYDDDDSLAEEIGNDVTRQLRQGLAEGEDIHGLTRRVELVMDDGDPDDGDRREKGITGQTKRTKAELIAHDSVQDAYNTAARKRYLKNGFRYGVIDATMDTKTSSLCRRLNEYVIDMVDSPWFVPPFHPYCRSGIRPILDVGDRQVLTKDDVADGYLQTIMSTKSYRPPVLEPDEFRPTPLTQEYGQA